MKDYLRTRGVEFDAINLQSNPEGYEELKGRNIRTLPAISVGDRFINVEAFSTKYRELDALLGLGEAAKALIPGPELVDRAILLLTAAMRYARQLPRDRYDDKIPGMKGEPLRLNDGTVVRQPDGTPYVPHDTNIGLVRHIIGHGKKFEVIAKAPGAEGYDRIEKLAPLGEPDARTDLPEMIAQTDQIVLEIRQWWDETRGHDLDCEVNAVFGKNSLHEVLQGMTYGLAQHSRQLIHVLRAMDIEPIKPLTDAAYEGLNLPEVVWG